MPAPAIPATTTYAPSCNNPTSNRGIIIDPTAAPEEVDADPLGVVPEAVTAPVGKEVTDPVPAVPAWPRRGEQEELTDPD